VRQTSDSFLSCLDRRPEVEYRVLTPSSLFVAALAGASPPMVATLRLGVIMDAAMTAEP